MSGGGDGGGGGGGGGGGAASGVLEVDRTSVAFGTVAVGDTVTEQVEVRNGTDAAVDVVAAGAGLVAAPASVPAETNVVVTLTWSPSAVGALSGTATIGTAAVSASGAAVDKLSFSPASVDLGSVTVGESGVANVLVQNHSASSATLEVTGTDAAAFVGAPLTVGAGMTVMVQITYTPAAAASHAASLAEVGAASPASALSGVGVEAVVAPTPTPPPAAPVDEHQHLTETGQRFTVDVPDSDEVANYAILNLGVSYSAGSIPIDGFAMYSRGKGFLTAEDNVAVQSVEDVRIQSLGSDLLALAGGDALIAAAGSVSVFGDDGVTISTAVDDPTTQADAESADARTFPSNDLDELNEDAGTALTRVLAGFDAIIAASTVFDAVCTVVEKTDDGVGAGERVWAGVTAAVAGAGAIASAMAVAGGGLAPGVTIYGHGGVFIASPFISGFYSAGGLVVGSMFPLVLGIDSEIRGLHAATLTGGKSATVQGGAVDITAKKASTLGSRGHTLPGLQRGDGELNLIGHTVNLKAHANVLTKETHAIVADDGQVTVAVGTYRVVIKPDGIKIGQASGVNTPDASHALNTAKPHVEIGDAEIKVLQKVDGAHITITDGAIKIEHAADGNGLVINDKVANLVDAAGKYHCKVQKNMVSIQGGSAGNRFQVKPAGLFFKGSKINLG